MKKRIVLFLVYALAFTFMMGSPLKVMGEGFDVTIITFDESGINPGMTEGETGFCTFESFDDGAGDSEMIVGGGLGYSGNSFRMDSDGVDFAYLWVNFSADYDYINKISIWIENTIPNSYIRFYNDTGGVARVGSGGAGTLWFYPVEGGTTQFSNCANTEDGFLNITHVSGNQLNYSWYNSADGTTDYLIGSSQRAVDWTNISRVRVDCKSVAVIYIDQITIDQELQEPDEGETNAPFYFDLYDIHTGTRLKIEGKGDQGFCDSNCGYTNYVETYFYCPQLWSGDYPGFEGGCHGNRITVEGYSYNIGEKYQFGFLYPIGCVNGEVRGYVSWVKNVTLYPGRTYSIFLSIYGYDDEDLISYCKMDRWGDEFGGDPFDAFFCIEKENYSLGETLRTKYRLPTEYWMLNNGYGTGGYTFQLFDKSKQWWENPVKTWPVSDYNGFTGDFETDFQITINTDNEFNETARQYYLRIGSNFLNPFVDCPDFFVGSEAWEPSGEILAVDPDPPAYGQETVISFIANNTCKLKLVHPGIPDEWSEEYLYSPETHFYRFNPFAYGYWNVILYVKNSDQQFVEEDNKGFTVVDDAGEPGEPAYNIEYLYIPDYRIIAGGNQSVNIQYRILSSTGFLNITSPRGEQSPFSTRINSSGRQHVFTLKPPIALGTWNVTLVGNETFQSSFNVIAEENNYVEFIKNEYYEDEEFSLLLKHSYYVALRFYKNGEAVGQSWRLREGQYPFETNLPVPFQYARPSVGSWRVELWRVNQELQMYKLAEWSCRVIPRPATDDGIPDQNELGDIVGSMVPYPYDIMVGAGIIIGLVFLPIGLVMGFNQQFGSRIEIKSEILLYICLMTGFIGYVLTIVWGLFPWWTVFTLLFALILIFAIKWYSRSSPAGE